ncbi:hypothetical protein BpHYR1_000823 [Brachionus plicatilis]|uniref:Uncharacterized protein n=1 Tax=Brachionus plicatilis TaxID=10195 RepID=A0A3M7P3G6_BRAPC|nr:hypothetical protein BpHYR1_000823 [Brachionus plicatilis]
MTQFCLNISLTQLKKKPKGFLDQLRLVPGSGSKRLKHKYALLQSDENDSINDSENDEQLGAQLDLNDDEEVVYEETMINNAKKRIANKEDSIKKYNLI